MRLGLLARLRGSWAGIRLRGECLPAVQTDGNIVKDAALFQRMRTGGVGGGLRGFVCSASVVFLVLCFG